MPTVVEAIKQLRGERPSVFPPDPTRYPSRSFGGQLVERIAPRACPCGGPAAAFQVREAPNNANAQNEALGVRLQAGYRIRWESPPLCPSCELARLIGATRPNLETRVLDRGVHRSMLLEAARWRSGLGTLAGRLEAEVLEEVARAAPGDWVPRSALAGHPHADTISHLVVNLVGRSEPPDSAFRLGRVEAERVQHLAIYDIELWGYVDRHLSLDHGQNNAEADYDDDDQERFAWCPALAPIPWMNAHARATGEGPIRSLFTRPELTNGHPVAVEVITFLRRREGNTLILVGV